VSDVKNRLNLGTALAEWPLRERPPSEWEDQAARIEAKIAASRANPALQQGPASPRPGALDILAPPSPASAEEVQDSSPPSSVSKTRSGSGANLETKMQTTERERDRKNLQDLARLASAPSLTPQPPKAGSFGTGAPPRVEPKSEPRSETRSEPRSETRSEPRSETAQAAARPAEAKLGDSGIVDLKMMAKADPTAEERAKTTPLATAELFDDDGRPSAPPASEATSKARMAAQGPVAVRAVAAPRSADAPKGRLFALAGGTTVLAIAAAAVFMVRASQQRPESARPAEVAAATSPHAAPPTPGAADERLRDKGAPATAANTEAKNGSTSTGPADDGIDITKLPLAENTKTMQKVYSGARPLAPKTAEKEKAIDPKLIANNLPPSPNQDGTLNQALKEASGSKDKAQETPTPAATGPAFAAGSVPQKPSQGALQGALGAVMPTVRACLQPDDPISRATVTFDSSGAVTSVSVSGFAAGGPAEACIKSALGKAKVAPFAEPSYAASFTIRPN
jgi:hypothetical protein